MDPDSAEGRRYRRGWIAAGHALAQDPSARLTCPSCGRGVLVVRDELIFNGTRVERWMCCNACGATNTLLITLDQASGKAASSTPSDTAKETKETGKSEFRDLLTEAVKSMRQKP